MHDCSDRFPAVWIGLAEVLPLPGNDGLGTAAGAIVNLIASAESSDQFARMVEHALDAKGCERMRTIP